MNANSYAVVAEVRLKELGSRLGLAAFIGVVAFVFAPSIWPVVWLCAVATTQAIDWIVFRPLRLFPETEPSKGLKIACCVTTALTVAVYTSMSAYVWLQGGVTGQVFGMIFCAGGLLHVSLHMHQSRTLLLSAAIPHATCFLGLPILTAVIQREPSLVLVTIGCMLYMTHLVVAVRQSSQTTQILRDANRVAGEERRKAEVASAAKSDFLAVISHEIRTPMNAVISAANLLRRTRLDGEQREHVSMLLDAGDVLMGLLNDVLDFSKIEAGKMELEQAPMNVRDKIEVVERLWTPRATAAGLRISVHVADEAPLWVSTDPLRLQQILFNLMSNAVKFTEQGEIVVTTGWRAEDLSLIFQVRDTGCGIPRERLVSIFNSFEQADAGTTRRYGGTGLGLAISRRLAELMGGSLTVESTEGVGSTFTLAMPVLVIEEAVPAPVAPAASALDDGLSGRHVLVVDDHPVNRRILGLLLEPHGCRLTFAENGLEALEAASAQPFDVILMDMQMPVMDGLEASRRIRASGLNQDTPLVALTANAMDLHRAAWEEVRADAFLTKPIDPALLVHTLAGLMAGTPDTDQIRVA